MTSTLCAATFNNSFVKCRSRYVMLRFVAVPFYDLLYIKGKYKAKANCSAAIYPQNYLAVMSLYS